MKEATRFLTSLAQAVSTMTLYKDRHPARERALDQAYQRLQDLQEGEPERTFMFLGDEIVVDGRPLRELEGWDWGGRLSAAGLQRVELVAPVERGDFEVFMEEVLDRLTGRPSDTAERRQSRPTAIRYGSVALQGGEGAEPSAEGVPTATPGYTLQDEKETVDWLHRELREGRELHLLEADTLVRSLSVAMHGDQAFLIPLLKLKRYDQYTTTHAMNVSVLSMALAEFIGLAPREVRTFGISGLLHDLGKVTVPDEILNKPGKLTDQERSVMNNHTVAGARIIMETEEHLDLAAVVAYEHHIRINGGGYPTLRYPRPCHQASNLVHVCDVFDALRTDRPYRDAWPTERAVGLIEDGAGTEFDADLAAAFVTMVRQWEDRIAYVRDEEEALPIGGVVRGNADEPSEVAGRSERNDPASPPEG
ncbi:MAG: HD domain-containing protein [Gemmatimonadetes bacterium]|nr:HD domain-containing protein [Gemmatimonadota bacterium]